MGSAHEQRSVSSRVCCLAMIAVALTCYPCASFAQGSPPGASDSVFRRAQRMANDGNAPAARMLVDSMLAVAREGSPEYADALFWRASLAESADAARRDYLRLTVEFSLSPRAEDALLRLAQIALSGGGSGRGQEAP